MASGGYRAPEHPAAVSGPGALSARTDGRPTVEGLASLSSGKYGETQALQADASGAPVAASSGPPHAGNLALAQAMQGGGSFGDPTAQAGTPVTAGSQYGPGPGPEALQANDPTRAEAQRLAQDGTLAALIITSQQDGVSNDFKQYVRALIAAL